MECLHNLVRYARKLSILRFKLTKWAENIQDRRANSEHSDVMAAWGKRRGLRECITGEGAVDEELAEKELLATTVHAILGAIYLDSDYSLLRVASPALMMMNATT